jgi:polyribonucleotide nucleotidyltransferase
MTRTFRLEEFGYEVELGKYARQADGAVWFKQGGTVILATVVRAASKDFPGFLPLSVDYREYFAAAGKIPGGYYKREGKQTDREVLTGRLIDRAVRPLFPSNFFDQVQVIASVYSVDREHTPNTVSLLASSLALTLSGIPFLGPVGVVEIARIEGEWIINPTYSQITQSNVRLVIAGTDEGICMVEGSSDQISEQEFIDQLFRAHDVIKKMVAWQRDIAQELGIEVKTTHTDTYDWSGWETRSNSFLTAERVKSVFIEDKVARNEQLTVLRDAFIAEHAETITVAGVLPSVVEYIFDAVLKDKLAELFVSLKKRVDNRDFEQVRKITIDVGILPYAHGSAVFTRGRTQALVTTTLGGGQDAQRMESLMGEGEEHRTFMLHYNFPPFSVGEVKGLRAPNRREIGHGHLAESSFRYVLPDKETFPYTIRLVADMLESDGSTSMATVCGSTMSLMQAGVPIKKMVSGIAMGLLKSSSGEFAVLSDISGFEDAFGLMDFKVVGTDAGITAIQMDIKYKGGLSREVFKVALEQARRGRAHILGEMQKVMDKPNPTLSDLVPKVVSFKIDTDKIGAVIGGGGKIIREIIDVTKTTIDIEDDGTVKIFGGPHADLDKAVSWVKTLAGQIERHAKYKGIIRRFAEFGMFVELVPGLDGLLHLSNMPREISKTFANIYKLGDTIPVEVVEYDKVTGRISLRLLPE